MVVENTVAVGLARRLPTPFAPSTCLLALALLGGVLLSGCSSDSGGSSGGSSTSIALTDENNFTTETVLDIPMHEVSAGADVEVCWDAVDADLQCHSLKPDEELDNVTLLTFGNQTTDDVKEKLKEPYLPSSDLDSFFEHNTAPGQTCAHLSDLVFGSTAMDIGEDFPEADDDVYMMTFTTGTKPGLGTRTMMFLKPTSDSGVTEVAASSGCGILDYTANLHDLEPLSVPADGPWVVDWSKLTRDGEGNAPPFTRIDRVLVGFYEGKDTGYLEENIFDIEQESTHIYTRIWEIELEEGRSANLADAVDRDDGSHFDGFHADAEGVWMLGLMCDECQNPAPILLTVLEPE